MRLLLAIALAVSVPAVALGGPTATPAAVKTGREKPRLYPARHGGDPVKLRRALRGRDADRLTRFVADENLRGLPVRSAVRLANAFARIGRHDSRDGVLRQYARLHRDALTAEQAVLLADAALFGDPLLADFVTASPARLTAPDVARAVASIRSTATRADVLRAYLAAVEPSEGTAGLAAALARLPYHEEVLETHAAHLARSPAVARELIHDTRGARELAPERARRFFRGLRLHTGTLLSTADVDAIARASFSGARHNAVIDAYLAELGDRIGPRGRERIAWLKVGGRERGAAHRPSARQLADLEDVAVTGFDDASDRETFERRPARGQAKIYQVVVRAGGATGLRRQGLATLRWTEVEGTGGQGRWQASQEESFVVGGADGRPLAASGQAEAVRPSGRHLIARLLPVALHGFEDRRDPSVFVARRAHGADPDTVRILVRAGVPFATGVRRQSISTLRWSESGGPGGQRGWRASQDESFVVR